MVGPTAEDQYTSWRHLGDMDKNQNQGSLSDLIASLEERFVSGKRTTHPAECNPPDERSLHPVIDIVSRLPTNEDYPLWRVRCKVTSFYFISGRLTNTICSDRFRGRNCFFSSAEGFPTTRVTIRYRTCFCKRLGISRGDLQRGFA